MIPDRPLRIVIPGGSGQIGELLARFFQERGHHVTVLTRGPYTAAWHTVHWDGEHTGPWTEHLQGADVCINLAGRSIDCRFTPQHREELYNSRIHSTQLLGDVIGSLSEPPRIWLNASTATIYRHSIDRPQDEVTGEYGGEEPVGRRSHPPEKWNFLVQLTLDWEAAFFAAFTPQTRKVALRTSLVMSPTHAGAFTVLLNLVRFSVGGTQGNGRQMVAWIHALDYARAIEFLIARDDIEGAVNLTAPHPLPNRDFMAALREAYGMPNGLPAPTPLLELAALIMRNESELVLKSRHVVPRRLLDAGFRFLFPDWREAAEDLVAQWRRRE
ncbi:MAG: TIGR01777 family oxidoreductase [Acidobacteriota bacterium]